MSEQRVFPHSFTNRKGLRDHRNILVPCCIIGLFLTASGARALAGDNTTTYTPVAERSTPTHRSVTDTEAAQLNIYVGGSLPVGTHLLKLQFLFDLTTAGNTSGYITPLLFEYKSVEAVTVYTVVGIGQGFEVQLSSIPQEIPFEVIEGTKVPTHANFTFGFIQIGSCHGLYRSRHRPGFRGSTQFDSTGDSL